MAKWISGINVHTPIPILQNLFTSRLTKTPEPRSHPQEEGHHPKSHSQPVHQRARPQPNPHHSSKALHPTPPKTTQLQRDRVGASIGSKHPIPTARQRDSPTSRTIPASAGPVPRSHLQKEAHHLKSHSQTARPQPNPPHPAKALYLAPTKTLEPQRDRAGASIGSKHPIFPSAVARSPTSRAIPASAGPVPRSHTRCPAEPHKKRTTVLRLPKPAPDCLIGPFSPNCA